VVFLNLKKSKRQAKKAAWDALWTVVGYIESLITNECDVPAR
jgi:hypothetical protein